MIKRHSGLFFLLLVMGVAFLLPALGYCDVESSLQNVQTKLTVTILPLAAILGLIFAGLSFVAGSPSARSNLILAIMGCVVGFGAESIMRFIRGLIH